MPKPDRKPDPDFEPDYDIADVEFDDMPAASQEVGADVEYEVPIDPDYEDVVQAAAVEVADPEYEEVAPVGGARTEVVLLAATASNFAFEVGRPVLPLTQQQAHPVVWRGHLKERHPTTGLVHRVPVYRLADGYWDCYREEELQVA
ncbi:MAG: hypothetical protein EOO62_11145 [Hymenobacter sp.]|nr:MAG: hypothetical protein EOO62_11145 [Hymenobacter sp.]